MTGESANAVRHQDRRGEIIHKAIAAGFNEKVVAGLFDLIIEELAHKPDAVQSRFLSFNGLALDLNSHEATYHEKPVDLTMIEYRLAEHFLRNPGRLLTHQNILRNVWGIDAGASSQQLLRVFISSLRRKISPEIIKTRPGEGYYLPLNS